MSLSDETIEKIRKLGIEAKANNNGKMPYGLNKSLGENYGVTSQFISQIISGKRRNKKSSKKKSGSPPSNPPNKKNEDKGKESRVGSGSSYIQKIKFRIPDFDSLKVFLEKNTNDPIFKIVLNRLIIGKKDSGLYQKIYYVIEEMNKKFEYLN